MLTILGDMRTLEGLERMGDGLDDGGMWQIGRSDRRDDVAR
jgi:hypothetical protein